LVRFLLPLLFSRNYRKLPPPSETKRFGSSCENTRDPHGPRPEETQAEHALCRIAVPHSNPIESIKTCNYQTRLILFSFPTIIRPYKATLRLGAKNHRIWPKWPRLKSRSAAIWSHAFDSLDLRRSHEICLRNAPWVERRMLI
jgi:hypothetical protein